MLSYVYMLLINVFWFQLKELPLAFLVQQVSWWLIPSAPIHFQKSVLSFLKDSFTKKAFLIDRFFFLFFVFSFRTLSISPHSLLACKVCAENSSDSLWVFFFFCMWKVSLLFLFSNFSVFDFWQCNYNVSHRGPLWVNLGTFELQVPGCV